MRSLPSSCNRAGENDVSSCLCNYEPKSIISINRAFSPIISQLVTWQRKWSMCQLPLQLRIPTHVWCGSHWPCILSWIASGTSKFRHQQSKFPYNREATCNMARKKSIQAAGGHATKNQSTFAMGRSLAASCILSHHLTTATRCKYNPNCSGNQALNILYDMRLNGPCILPQLATWWASSSWLCNQESKCLSIDHVFLPASFCSCSMARISIWKIKRWSNYLHN